MDVNNFIKEAKDRYKSDTPDFWKNMKPIMGFTFGGLSAVQALIPDGTPLWIKGVFVFVCGGIGYFVGNFGTKNNNLIK